MKNFRKLQNIKVDLLRTRLPLHISNLIERKVFATGRTRSQVVREALEKSL
jgi:predicted DNA-binding protein